MAKEKWLPVPGWEGIYEVSNLGRVKSKYGRFIYVKGGRYPRATLSKDGSNKTVFIHVLVAAAFLGPKPPGKEVAHRDGNNWNPKLKNLRYATKPENRADMIRHKTITAKLTYAQVRAIRRLGSHGHRPCDLAKRYPVTPQTISKIINLSRWSRI